MGLPVINVPTYELTIPSSKEKLTFRPFLVKEEKILLLALEDGSVGALNQSLKQIVNNCTFDKVEVNKMATFDLEYIFLRIRAKSVGETSTINVLAEDDGETYVPDDVPLEEIEVDFPQDHTNDVKLTDTIGVTFRYPTYETLDKMDNLDEESGIERVFALMAECVDKVYDLSLIHI